MKYIQSVATALCIAMTVDFAMCFRRIQMK